MYSGPETEERCALKNSEQAMKTMNMRQSSELSRSIVEIGYGCPYQDDGSFASCGWFERKP